MTQRKLTFGVAGLGRAFVLMSPALAHHPNVQLVAAADPRAEARAKFAADFDARVYPTVDELCADADIDAVYIATPHQFHAHDAIAAANRGKHVLVEKPMALSLDDCERMIEAARKSGVQLVVGHSHSFDAPIARMREIIAGGTVGRLKMITALNFTDFLYRPRRPEELARDSGGVLVNQAPHHVEIARLLGGGKVKSVRAFTGAWDENRPVEGAYHALLTFEDGVAASLTYSGYAHFDSDEFQDWIAESGYGKESAAYGSAREALSNLGTATEELSFKIAHNYGGAEAALSAQSPRGPKWHQHFGFVIASCEHADLRPTPKGVMIYGDRARSFESVPVPDVPRTEVIDEFYDAVVNGKPALHDGPWSLATMEVCLAMLQSARERREILLKRQIAVAC